MRAWKVPLILAKSSWKRNRLLNQPLKFDNVETRVTPRAVWQPTSTGAGPVVAGYVEAGYTDGNHKMRFKPNNWRSALIGENDHAR
jgi:hypothetical protein